MATKTQNGFTEEEKEAVKARAKELAAEAKANRSREEGEKAVLDAIKAMPQSDKAIATKLHELVTKNAPMLIPKTWYGMPAYANDEGHVVCFYQGAYKFKTRYGTFGFQQDAKLDDGNMWPVAFAVIKLTSEEESKIVKLLKKAVN